MFHTRARRAVLVAGASVALAAAGLLTGGGSAQAVTGPGALPVGAAPKGFAYAIGKRLYLNGAVQDLTGRWSSIAPKGFGDATAQQEFSDVDQTRGIPIWAFNWNCNDMCGRSGAVRSLNTPSIVEDHTPSLGRVATTTGGFVVLDHSSAPTSGVSSTIRNYAGTAVAPAFSDSTSIQANQTDVSSVGGSFVIAVQDAPTQQMQGTFDRSWLVTPTHAKTALPDNTYGAGTGWLTTATTFHGSCYRTSAVATPTAYRAQLCSQTRPKVSPDGTMAVLVQGRHVRLYDARTGTQRNAATLPSLPSWDATHSYQVMGWEDASHYLVNVRDGSGLWIVRCSTSGACQRAVSTTVRTGVSRIVS